jgi:hypothetical protein
VKTATCILSCSAVDMVLSGLLAVTDILVESFVVLKHKSVSLNDG